MNMKKLMLSSTALIAIAIVLTATVFASAAWAFSAPQNTTSQTVNYQDALQTQVLTSAGNTWSTSSALTVNSTYYQDVYVTPVDASNHAYDILMVVTENAASGKNSTSDFSVIYGRSQDSLSNGTIFTQVADHGNAMYVVVGGYCRAKYEFQY